ncbi:hypothetical protein [Lewinella sp. LCG006]|uniref:hypothetical protein n=1 Tax=Lewinella sp. LCG006 TaxID=3231911 RepID=UPI003460C78A
MLRLLLLGVLFLGGHGLLSAQMAKDTLSPAQVQAEFISELETLMTEGKPKPVEEAYRTFAEVFSSGAFTPEEQTQITNTGLLMRSKRLGASPHFQDYLETLINIKQNTAYAEQFTAWNRVLESMLKDDANFTVNTIGSFLKFSNDFFGLQAIKYSPASVSWFVFAEKFDWAYDKEPVLKVQNADLTGLRSDDTIMINQTNFDYYPLENVLKGSGGKTTWQRTELGSAVFVDLERYEVETIRSIYDAEVAYLTYPQYFGDKRVKGTFTDKLVSDDSRTSYPRFESTEGYINIPNVREGVRLRGGFRLHGATVYAFGSKDAPAELLVLNDRNQPRFQGVGNLVTIKEQDRIVGSSVNSIVYLGADSLYHPSVNVRLNLSDLSMELTRGKKGTDRYPFYHSLHQMNIDADFIKVFLNEDSLIIGRPTASFVNKGDVVFESLNYFDPREYNRVQNIATANPLAIMKATAEREGTNFMSASLLASRLNSKFTVENIRPLIYDLVSKGFIAYDPETDEIEMKEKIYHYVNADAGNVDYDYLQLVSQTDTINASIGLGDGYTVLNGVKRIDFSKPQRVATLPSGNQVFLKGNRNFDFDGQLFAGYSVMEGKDFHFQYESNQIDLDSVRYFDLFVPTGNLDENNKPEAFSIGSRIEHLQGVLLVDAPNNKSGRKDIPIFPSLQSKGNSYVFYDRSDTQDGVYTRDSFYFEIAPFSFDHLDRYGPQDVHFKGKLFSNGMFPEIKETLVLQEDQSLGFSTETPTEGYPAYDDKGTFTGEMKLDNNGLLGKGRLNYLQAVVDAEDFTFMPKRTTASADAFDLEEDRVGAIPVPEVHGEAVNLEWRPYSDSLIVKSAEAPFELYQENDHQLEGTLVLTPSGLRGSGSLGWSLGEAESTIFSFGANSAVADTMLIKINVLEVDDRLGLETDNVNGSLDYDEGVGHFEANDESVITTLPYNQYTTSMNKFDWDMKGSTITFESDKDNPALFTSIHPDQDSLQFRGEEATYDLKTSLLAINGVDYIVSSDAFIYPDSQYIEISANAEMARLENAKIIADTTSKYHVINRATVDIKGRRVYEASGFYEYNVGPHQQEFELDNIIGQPIGKGGYKEKLSVTRATGEIQPTDTFFIDHKTQFRGTISLDAEEKSLRFDGYARFNAENLPNKYWFTVSFAGDKNDLVIDYDVPNSYENEPLFSGLFLSKEFSRVYPRIITPLYFRKDRKILDLSTGVIKYLEDKDQFILGDSAIILGNEIVGNKMLFKNVDGSVEAEGKFTLGSELRYMQVDAAGRATTAFPPPAPEEEPEVEETGAIMLADEPLVEEEETEASVAFDPSQIAFNAEWMMGLKMRIPENLLKIVQNDFESASFESRAIGYLTDIAFYQKTVRELFPAGKERDDALAGLGLGVLDVPKKLNPYDFLFSKLPMKWHQDYQSFVSTEKNNGIISISGVPLNKQVECYVELKMPSTDADDRLYVYLKSPSGLFYFFGFKQGILSITSNNTVFMQQLEGMKVKDLIMKMDDGETFEIVPVELSSANLFLRRIQAVQ